MIPKGTEMRYALLAVLVLGTPCSAADPMEKPNIVFILADDLGREDCGFMGGQDIKTPQIDKLAAAGARLDAFYVQPVCSPTRAALMTGRYPMRHGLQVGVVRPYAQYGLPLEERTLPQALKEAGYTTAIVGKWHLGHFAPEYLPTRRGFDHQYGHYNGQIDYFTHIRDGGFDWHKDDQACRDEGYSTHLIAKDAVKFVNDNAGKKPFFLYVPFNAVHAPHQAPENYAKQYPQLKGERLKYAGMLAAMDEAVGQIVDAVEKAGVRKNTLFVFSSDNGGPQPGVVTDNGKYREGKGTLYEGGIRVASCATWEGQIKPGSTITEPMHMVDWYPTLLKLSGSKVEQKLPVDGLDIWPTLTAGKPSPHDSILLNTTPNTGAVRASDWKLVIKTGVDDPDGGATKKNNTESIELFNLKDDPFEKTNLAEKNPEKVKELRAALAGFAKQAVPPKSKPKSKGFVTPKVWGEKD
ncbi:MAG: arylsulfatase [Planctomycetaceae bacterium]|nr:arylsulfatase [Planctomycetaceae bacterium]